MLGGGVKSPSFRSVGGPADERNGRFPPPPTNDQFAPLATLAELASAVWIRMLSNSRRPGHGALYM